MPTINKHDIHRKNLVVFFQNLEGAGAAQSYKE